MTTENQMSESEEEYQIEKDEDEDFYWGDDEDEEEILGYECMGCGNFQDHETGFGCDQCAGRSLEPWYG